MCYGAEAAWVPAFLEMVGSAATTEGAATAAGTAAAGAGAAGAAGAGAGVYAGMTAAEIAAALEAIGAGEAAGFLGGEALAGAGAGSTGLMGYTGATSAPGAGAYELATYGAGQGMGSVSAPPTSIPNALQSMMAGGGGSGTAGNMAKTLAMQQGMGMLSPQPAAPPPQGRPMSGQAEPLRNPYGERAGPYGTSAGNSMGLLGETEEERRKRLLKMRGLMG